jgi:acetyl-CoA acyltransferase
MSMLAMGGWRAVPHAQVAKDNPSWYHGMGLTAEAVAKEYGISREAQDTFGANSVAKALAAIDAGRFKSQILPIEITENYIDEKGKKATRNFTVDTDEGPRRGTTVAGLSSLKPAFMQGGSVTAGNTSQTSDGAAFLLVVSEKALKQFGLTPIARLVDYQVSGVEPYKMGIGPVFAIPKVLQHAGLQLTDIDLFELNEAFASQSLAVLQELQLNPEIVNVNGGAIALGHPLGATGAKLTVQLLSEMRQRGNKYGMVTMCIGSGQGGAGIFELL